MTSLQWEKYTAVMAHASAREWLEMQANLGLALNTIDAYGRALNDYLRFTRVAGIDAATARRHHVARWVSDLRQRPTRAGAEGADVVGLANATLRQRLTAVRLFYDHLVAEGACERNPVGRGRYRLGGGFGVANVPDGEPVRGLVPRREAPPWIPTDAEWRAVLGAGRGESLRNRTMFALSYDAALRREELCGLEVRDIDVANRLVTVRAETTKGRRRTRVVPYSRHTNALYAVYLVERRAASRRPGPLFLSESRRNRAQPISIWTWSKVVERIAARADVPQFSTHTCRHLCLTDLAHAGWDVHEIATFAGHHSIQTTLQYIHLSGRELASKLAQGMASLHAWRVALLEEVFG